MTTLIAKILLEKRRRNLNKHRRLLQARNWNAKCPEGKIIKNKIQFVCKLFNQFKFIFFKDHLIYCLEQFLFFLICILDCKQLDMCIKSKTHFIYDSQQTSQLLREWVVKSNDCFLFWYDWKYSSIFAKFNN